MKTLIGLLLISNVLLCSEHIKSYEKKSKYIIVDAPEKAELRYLFCINLGTSDDDLFEKIRQRLQYFSVQSLTHLKMYYALTREQLAQFTNDQGLALSLRAQQAYNIVNADYEAKKKILNLSDLLWLWHFNHERSGITPEHKNAAEKLAAEISALDANAINEFCAYLKALAPEASIESLAELSLKEASLQTRSEGAQLQPLLPESQPITLYNPEQGQCHIQ